MSSVKNRQSNIELLRLVSMLMIVIWHFNGHALDPSNSTIWANAFQSLTVAATTIFVLISGYFGIRFKVRSVIKLYLQCFIWGLVSYLLCCWIMHEPVGSALFGRIFAFTHNKWWFVDCYLYLMFVSPLLNVAIEHLNKKNYQYIILLSTFVVVYFGYCHQMGDDTWGTCALHFMYIYLIGRYINKYICIDTIRHYRWLWMLIFVICSLIIFGLSLLAMYKGHLMCCLEAYPYNSPWTMLAAVSFLLFALSFDFECKTVNWLAGSALAGYLFQDSLYFGFIVLYPFVSTYSANLFIGERYALLIPISLIFLLVVILVDKIWQCIFIRPCLILYDKLADKITHKISGFSLK